MYFVRYKYLFINNVSYNTGNFYFTRKYELVSIESIICK